jgi:hypothetical protein
LPTQSICLSVPLEIPGDTKASTQQNAKTDEEGSNGKSTASILQTARN